MCSISVCASSDVWLSAGSIPWATLNDVELWNFMVAKEDAEFDKGSDDDCDGKASAK